MRSDAAPRWLCVTALLLCGCPELGLVVDVDALSEVGALDTVTVQVVSEGVVVADQALALNGKSLPQSIAVVSRGATTGPVTIVVQGLAASQVAGVGQAETQLKAQRVPAHVSVVLAAACPGPRCACQARVCPVGACGQLDDGCQGTLDCGGCPTGHSCVAGQCQCQPKTCQANSCGTGDDGCGQSLNCGACPVGQTCGAGGVPNVCGTGTCTPLTSCPAGFNCGSTSDGCSSTLNCGSCTPPQSCTNNRCTCAPLTKCPAGLTCGTLPDGCGGTISCGTCTTGQTCGGADGGTPNVCSACTPQCTGATCGAPDGCGGRCQNGSCAAGQSCLQGLCCIAGQTNCAGQCVDLNRSSANCGACGRQCPNGRSCSGGLCPCTSAADNIDGHCCPAGFTFTTTRQGVYECFAGPFDAGTQLEAVDACHSLATAFSDAGISPMGAGMSTNPELSMPGTACGSFQFGAHYATRVSYGSGGTVNFHTCQSTCLSNCSCSTCLACQSLSIAPSCVQPYYCVVEPLGPTQNNRCNAGSDCPMGYLCQGNNCVKSALKPCYANVDCDGGIFSCGTLQRGTDSLSGFCQ